MWEMLFKKLLNYLIRKTLDIRFLFCKYKILDLEIVFKRRKYRNYNVIIFVYAAYFLFQLRVYSIFKGKKNNYNDSKSCDSKLLVLYDFLTYWHFLSYLYLIYMISQKSTNYSYVR